MAPWCATVAQTCDEPNVLASNSRLSLHTDNYQRSFNIVSAAVDHEYAGLTQGR